MVVESDTGEYYLYNQNLSGSSMAAEQKADRGDVREVFNKVDADTVGQYFSGHADGMGFGRAPENKFSSLLAVWRWIRKQQAK